MPRHWPGDGRGDGDLSRAVLLVEKLVFQHMQPEKALDAAVAAFDVDPGALRSAVMAAARARRARR